MMILIKTEFVYNYYVEISIEDGEVIAKTHMGKKIVFYCGLKSETIHSHIFTYRKNEKSYTHDYFIAYSIIMIRKLMPKTYNQYKDLLDEFLELRLNMESEDSNRYDKKRIDKLNPFGYEYILNHNKNLPQSSIEYLNGKIEKCRTKVRTGKLKKEYELFQELADKFSY